MSGFCGFEGLLVNAREGQVQGNVLELASIDIVLFDLRERLTDVSSTVSSLVVGELDQSQARVRLAFEGAGDFNQLAFRWILPLGLRLGCELFLDRVQVLSDPELLLS